MSVIGLDEVLKRIHEEKLIEGLSNRELNNPEGVGIDLRLDKIFKVTNGGAFIENDAEDQLGKRKGIETELVAEFDPKSKDQPFVQIEPNEYYLVQTIEILNTPMDLMPIIYPRGTLLKIGLLLLSSKGDPGYKGFVAMGLKNLSQFPVKLQMGARFCNIVFHKIEGTTSAYRGQHQGGRITIHEEERQV